MPKNHRNIFCLLMQRNYRYYLMFIFSALVFFMYVFAFSSWRIRRKMVNTGLGVFGVIQSAPEIFALAVFSFVSIWFLGGLLVFHAYLITLNQVHFLVSHLCQCLILGTEISAILYSAFLEGQQCGLFLFE